MSMNDKWREQQFRMRRLQVCNWGTFSGLHIVPISEKGHLFIGRSGSGKSSLLDSISALLIPQRWREFNAAAKKGEKGRHDRSWVSYIRGAWSEQTMDDGQIATQFLRMGTTWSALALEYGNQQGQIVSLIQLHWIKGNSNQEGDVKHHFMIAKRSFDVKKELEGFQDTDIRKLKQRLVEVKPFDTFESYGEHFRHLFSIENDIALKLLQKTQAAKDLGRDLNEFLRDFMLDTPETFDVADRLVEGFTELNSAHSEVVDARKQIAVLIPAREDYRQYKIIEEEIVQLAELEASVEPYKNRQEKVLAEDAIKKLHAQDMGLEAQEKQQLQTYLDLSKHLKLLEDEYGEKGGARIQELERDIKDAERESADRTTKETQAVNACKTLDRILPKKPLEFSELASEARGILDRRKESSRQDNDKLLDLSKRLDEVEKNFANTVREVNMLKRKPSNIDANMHELRQQVATAVGIPEDDLPFVGELIEVKKEESAWRGATERLLRGFAFSLLVDDNNYAAVSNYINNTDLNRRRLVYYRTTPAGYGLNRSIDEHSLFNKLIVKESVYKPWLDSELKKRFDYICARDMKEFRQADYAISREGQVKHGKSKHEKDDRKTINDPHEWVLGFDNSDKRRLYESLAKQQAAEIADLSKQRKKLQEEMENQQDRLIACQTLANLQWQEIDVSSVMDRIKELSQMKNDLRNSASKTLQEIENRIVQQKENVKEADDALRNTRVDRETIKRDNNKLLERLEEAHSRIAETLLSDTHETMLSARFESAGVLTLDSLDKLQGKVKLRIVGEKNDLGAEQAKKKAAIERCFRDFLGQWRGFDSNFKDTLDFAPDFIIHLDKLERDGLPKVEDRFFALLSDQGTQNITALNSYIAEARKKIRDRMDEVNSVLETVPYNSETFLQIEVSDRHLSQVQAFREQIKQVLSNSWITTKDEAEARFEVLRGLVLKLGSEDKIDLQWKKLVLDVRQHVEFVGKEYDKKSKQEKQVHRSGAGKSGGQREKLAATILAAALRYQLGSADNEPPVYAPVVIDEALANSDNEFSETVIKIFIGMGFQLVLATPLKSVMTIEPYIGGATFVDIVENKQSSTLQIDYNEDLQRLNLPEAVNG